mgnify:CR=1 FL=1
MPASRVEKAEVMYSAPPQYHVRGAAINLVLKGYKPGEGGLQGEVNGEYKQQKEAGGNGGVTLAYTSPKIDLDFMYNLQSNYTRGYIDFIARHTVKEQIYDVNQVTDNEGRSLTHTLRVGGTYKFDKDNSLNLSYTTQFSPDKTGDSIPTGIFPNHSIILRLTTRCTMPHCIIPPDSDFKQEPTTRILPRPIHKTFSTVVGRGRNPLHKLFRPVH